jgi:membrane-associated phospholipid phosphatase
MWTLIKNNSWFYIIYFIALIISCFFILTTEKLQLHQQINHCVGNSITDNFFKYITHLGDGLFLIIVSLLICFFDVKKGIILLFAYAICGGLTQFLKEVFFNFEMRPYFYYSFHQFPLKIVEGVDMHSQNSFPSGHATAALCLFTLISFYTSKKLGKIGIAILALIVSFSRVYLSQHFTEDITVGSLIGVVFTSLVIYIFYFTNFKLKLIKLEKPIQQLFKSKNA